MTRDAFLIVFSVVATILIVSTVMSIGKAIHDARTTQRKTIADRFGGTMNFILVLLGMTGLAFTVTMIVVYCKMGGIPDTLVTCFFAAVFGECGVMGLLKKAKIGGAKKESKK